MPELSAIHFGLLVLMLAIGTIIGWILRSDRCAKEKIAVSASWQEQLESQQSEHNRLAEQNKSLMEQISQYQASQKDYSNRAKELSSSLKEALAKRDEMQRQMKDIRGNLEVAIAQRDRLKENLQSKNVSGQSAALKEKDDKIFRLSRELTSWQSRVPPLVERFQDRDKQARQLEEDLDKAHTRLSALETMIKSDQTRIEPVDADSLPDGGDASNEPIAVTSAHDTLELQDQVEDHIDDESADSEFMSMDGFDEPATTDVEDEVTKEFSAVFDVPNTGSAESDNEEDSSEEPAEKHKGDDLEDADEEEDTGDDPDDDDAEEDPGDDPDDDDAEEDPGDDPDDDDDRPGEDEPDTPDAVEEKDDLRKIKGIGPSIEKTLHSLGIHRFHQLAEMSEYEIDRVAQQLKGFRSRIYREDWIGQARDLHYQKDKDRS